MSYETLQCENIKTFLPVPLLISDTGGSVTNLIVHPAFIITFISLMLQYKLGPMREVVQPKTKSAPSEGASLSFGSNHRFG